MFRFISWGMDVYIWWVMLNCPHRNKIYSLHVAGLSRCPDCGKLWIPKELKEKESEVPNG